MARAQRKLREDPEKRSRYLAYMQAYHRRPEVVAKRKERAPAERPRVNARALLRYHVKSGNVVKPTACQRCGAGGRIEGHHEDDARPLTVTWLCKTCHALVRRIHA